MNWKINTVFQQNIVRDNYYNVKLGDKEGFDKEQIDVKEPFSVTKCQFTS